MEAWKWLVGGVAVLGVVAALYGLDRLGLWLEDRGWLYYRRKKPGSSPAGCLVAFQQVIEPGAKHVIQLKHGAQGRVSREQLLAKLIDCLAADPVDVEKVRRLLGTAARGGLDWRELYQEAAGELRTGRPDLAARLPPPDAVQPAD
jgi:hypothetical protein